VQVSVSGDELMIAGFSCSIGFGFNFKTAHSQQHALFSFDIHEEVLKCDFQFIWASFFPLDTEPFRKQTFSLVLEAPMVSDADIVTLSTEVSHTTRWFSFITVTLYLQVGYHTSHLSTCCQWLSQSIFTKITHDFTTTTTSWHWIAYYVLMCS